ncbi:aminotransferase class V-fold PLP-dependent enzyme [Amaricoccus sp.]|uniref:aminotransferase class V-fold PLP-dependent enzyme n=1 Tax=Amaricoccus sp. TaxID=1872485 RepID=UPI001B6B846D|nr:aminotransferase class V-fold PLP-dependent enzyme [Amaricoccus sp.]MBP7241897.1 alanine--glyoxylate aminotransferase family protein [Amaricoccus sp.]
MTWTSLPDAPGFPAEGYAPLADAVGRILGTRNDVLLVQGEAAVALEAVAASLGRPGMRALCVVTSMYGRWIAGWLRRAGATAVELVAAPGRPVEAAAVAVALASGRFDLVTIVHAESATGILNPLEEVVALARSHGALVVVDAVASVGGHALDVDAAGIDVAVIGPQKALGGQAGVSALSVSPAAWERVAPPGEAPSILSLGDLRSLWLGTGRGALPGTPSALEFHALAATLARVQAEGMPSLRARHRRAAAAARAGALALTGRAWVASAHASNLVTAAALPEGLDAARALAAAGPATALSAGAGPGGERLVRMNHTGARARLDVVLGDLAALGRALRAVGMETDVGRALAAAEAAADGCGEAIP